MGRQIPVWATICLIAVVALSSAMFVWALTSLKVIRGTSFVEYRGDIEIVDFKFVSDTAVAVTIRTNVSPTPSCTITVSGAGISGSKSIAAGWPSPTTVTIPITGALTSGTITIEITT
jgi:hypothetical protein